MSPDMNIYLWLPGKHFTTLISLASFQFAYRENPVTVATHKDLGTWGHVAWEPVDPPVV